MGDSGQVSSSSYLIACDETERERQKELLYKVMGPVFFGQKAAENSPIADGAAFALANICFL